MNCDNTNGNSSSSSGASRADDGEEHSETERISGKTQRFFRSPKQQPHVQHLLLPGAVPAIVPHFALPPTPATLALPTPLAAAVPSQTATTASLLDTLAATAAAMANTPMDTSDLDSSAAIRVKVAEALKGDKPVKAIPLSQPVAPGYGYVYWCGRCGQWSTRSRIPYRIHHARSTLHPQMDTSRRYATQRAHCTQGDGSQRNTTQVGSVDGETPNCTD